MLSNTEYVASYLAWLSVVLFMVWQAWNGTRPVVGLSLCYLANLALIHLVSEVTQSISSYTLPNREQSMLGFSVTAYLLVGLLAGNLFASLLDAKANSDDSVPPEPPHMAGYLIITGLILYFVLSRLSGRLPSIAAVVSGGMALAIAGFCLWWWRYWIEQRVGESWGVAACALMIPAMTVISDGFLGFGVAAMLTLSAFIGVHYRPRLAIVIGAPFVLFFGLSLWSTYAASRNTIRASVWGGDAISRRIDSVSNALQQWSWFDVDNQSHLEHIDNRLNQNFLVGAAREQLESGAIDYAEGETLFNALIAVIPRVLWPDKPTFAGSADLVTEYTGIIFAQGTSVGIGHVMELYINYGRISLFVGGVVLGFTLGLFDFKAGRSLHVGDYRGFLCWFIPGQALLNVGGNLAESTASLAAYWILALVVTSFLSRQEVHPPFDHAK